MYEQKLIIPKNGKIIPLHDGNGNLPANGKVLTLSSYWYRLEKDGDVEFSDVPAEAPTEEAAASTAADAQAVDPAANPPASKKK